jgi:hypothetical protein
MPLNEPPDEPRYKRPLLPAWLPPWLVVCLAVGAALGYVATYVPREPRQTTTAFLIGFGIGFALGVLLLILARLRLEWWGRAASIGPGFDPPAWLAILVVVAALVGLGYVMVDMERASGQKGRPMLEDPAAVVGGFALIAAGGGLSVWMLVRKPRRPSFLAAGLMGSLLFLAGLALAVARVWERLL